MGAPLISGADRSGLEGRLTCTNARRFERLLAAEGLGSLWNCQEAACTASDLRASGQARHRATSVVAASHHDRAGTG